eukprot:6194668-Pleurochrysis_carterae.AAC.2
MMRAPNRSSSALRKSSELARILSMLEPIGSDALPLTPSRPPATRAASPSVPTSAASSARSSLAKSGARTPACSVSALPRMNGAAESARADELLASERVELARHRVIGAVNAAMVLHTVERLAPAARRVRACGGIGSRCERRQAQALQPAIDALQPAVEIRPGAQRIQLLDDPSMRYIRWHGVASRSRRLDELMRTAQHACASVARMRATLSSRARNRRLQLKRQRRTRRSGPRWQSGRASAEAEDAAANVAEDASEDVSGDAAANVAEDASEDVSGDAARGRAKSGCMPRERAEDGVGAAASAAAARVACASACAGSGASSPGAVAAFGRAAAVRGAGAASPWRRPGAAKFAMPWGAAVMAVGGAAAVCLSIECAGATKDGARACGEHTGQRRG